MMTSEALRLAVRRVEAELGELVALGPRFHCTAVADVAAGFIKDRLEAAGVGTDEHTFSCTGWTLDAEPLLSFLAPVQEERVECEAMLWSGGTGEEGVVGDVEIVGNQRLWAGGSSWRKFAVVEDGRLLAFLCARRDGPAIPQPLPDGSIGDITHLVIGETTGRRIEGWLQANQRVRVQLQLLSTTGRQGNGRNIIGRVPGQGGSLPRRVIVCAHYDTMWNTPGAYDNASGVIALLELARKVEGKPPPFGVEFVFFSGEEWHLAGSQAFVRDQNHAEMDGIAFVINIDGLGRGDFLELSVGPEAFEWEVRRAIKTFPHERKLRLESTFPPLVSSDHAPFYQAGIPVMHLTFNDWPLLHHRDDLPNEGSVANIVYTMGLVEHLVWNLPYTSGLRQPRGLL